MVLEKRNAPIVRGKDSTVYYQADFINNQNKALGIDTYSIQASNDFHSLKAVAEALNRQIINCEKGLEAMERVENPTNSTADVIHKMTTNYRHQSALLYQVEKRMYEINPVFYVKYIKTKDKGFSYSAMFYSIAEKTLFGFVFAFIDKKTKENFSF